ASARRSSGVMPNLQTEFSEVAHMKLPLCWRRRKGQKCDVCDFLDTRQRRGNKNALQAILERNNRAHGKTLIQNSRLPLHSHQRSWQYRPRDDRHWQKDVRVQPRGSLSELISIRSGGDDQARYHLVEVRSGRWRRGLARLKQSVREFWLGYFGCSWTHRNRARDDERASARD